MAVSFKVGTLELNNGSSRYLLHLDFGDPQRDEVWIEPPIAGVEPVLVRSIEKKTQMTLTLAVKGSSVANVQTLVRDIRTEFEKKNTVTFSPGSGASTVQFTTYPSALEPAFRTGEELYTVANYFWVPKWTFTVWRGPTSTSPVL